jgi:hypothetical protein
VTYGVWIGVRPEDLQRAFRVWWEPDYLDLRVNGLLANVIQPWGLRAAPVHLAVRDPEQTPYCVSSPDAVFADVLDDEAGDPRMLAAGDPPDAGARRRPVTSATGSCARSRPSLSPRRASPASPSLWPAN